MRVESHATISTRWPGHLAGGLSGLTWPAKDTSWECPPHILQCHLYNVCVVARHIIQAPTLHWVHSVLSQEDLGRKSTHHMTHTSLQAYKAYYFEHIHESYKAYFFEHMHEAQQIVK